jgi:hypothetical protein
MRGGQGKQSLESQSDAYESPIKKKWLQLAMKSGFGEQALEGRGACVELRRGVAITRPQGSNGQLWWGVALPAVSAVPAAATLDRAPPVKPVPDQYGEIR